MNTERARIEQKTFEYLFQKTGITEDQIKSKTRKREVVQIRQAICYFLNEYHKNLYSLKRIGKTVGGRHHSTVIHAIDVVTEQMEYENDFIKNTNSRETTNLIKDLKENIKIENVLLSFTRFDIEDMKKKELRKVKKTCHVCTV